uniref:Uncharacterized protein n=2 Tax=Babesia bovis TaxID=5865 RepID=S6B0K8_BABBO|nr:hypothetical protein [Babesia bovis]
MTGVREYLVYGVDDAYKHLWPIQYHLLHSDYLAAIDSLRQGANPLESQGGCASALSLCYQLFFKTLNKCLNTTIPLGILQDIAADASVTTPTCKLTSSPNRCNKSDSADSPVELHGMADYNLGSLPAQSADSDVPGHTSFTCYVEASMATKDIHSCQTIHQKLLRRLKGLFTVLRAMSERKDLLLHCKQELLSSVGQLHYPELYNSIMDYLFKYSKRFISRTVDVTNVWDAHMLWKAATSKDAKLKLIATFISKVATIFESLCGLFHVNIYNTGQKSTGAICSGHDRHLRLNSMNPCTVEILAHMSFVIERPLLFDAMVLQEFFLQEAFTFKWNELLSHLLSGGDRVKVYADSLMRRSLRHNVEYRIESCNAAI